MKYMLVFIIVFFLFSSIRAQVKCLSGDCENGKGTAQIKEDNKKIYYFGSFSNGKFDGYGEWETTERSFKIKYKGQFKKGKFEGRGEYTKESSEYLYRYSGNFKDSKYHGQGTYETHYKKAKNFEIKEGVFHKDSLNGLAKVITQDFTYIGYVSNGIRHGLGLIAFNDGESYSGYFDNNMFSDFGYVSYKNRFRVAGQIVDGMCCSGFIVSYTSKGDYFVGLSSDTVFGKQKYASSNDYYVGQLEDGIKKGPGVLWTGASGQFKSWGTEDPDYPDTFFFSKKDTACLTGDCNNGINLMINQGIKHTGYFTNSIADGYGVREFPDSTTYYAYFDNETRNMQDSTCIIENPDSFYISEWKDSSLFGKGIIIEKSNKKVYIGEISGNKPNGEGILVTERNQILKIGQFENGDFIENE
ncbi:MAG: hypothetical protein PHP52_09745 [Bacteroidales bacterium]|nr:hypothetical protein [Bacteroidales bacterium]